MPKLRWILTSEDGADHRVIGEQVVLIDLHLLGHHLIDEIGCYRLPELRRLTHRPNRIELENN